MTTAATAFDLAALSDPSVQAIEVEARRGLTLPLKSLAPWLFYDEIGSMLFEQITELPEYYLTRTERALFTAHATQIFAELGLSAKNPGEPYASTQNGAGKKLEKPAPFEDAVSDSHTAPIPFPRTLTVVELGAGTASKTGVLLHALTNLQREVIYPAGRYQPLALSRRPAPSSSAAIPRSHRPPARARTMSLSRFPIVRPAGARVLALYIGSSIGNFSPSESRDIRTRLRSQLAPGDALLLGADLAPSLAGTNPPKPIAALLAAYNDAAGSVTAAFNRNVLVRLNRELGTNFEAARFTHSALWNPTRSRIEMHLVSAEKQTVILPRSAAGPALPIHFAAGETIHTESSYKFTPAALTALFSATHFKTKRSFTDLNNLFSVTLARAGVAAHRKMERAGKPAVPPPPPPASRPTAFPVSESPGSPAPRYGSAPCRASPDSAGDTPPPSRRCQPSSTCVAICLRYARPLHSVRRSSPSPAVSARRIARRSTLRYCVPKSGPLAADPGWGHAR